MKRRLLIKPILAFVFIALISATSILAILHNDMVMDENEATEPAPAPPRTETATVSTETAQPAEASKPDPGVLGDLKKIENDLSNRRTADAEPLSQPGQSSPADEKERAAAAPGDDIIATISIQVPAAVAEEKIEPKQTETVATLVTNASAVEADAAPSSTSGGVANETTNEETTPAPFVVVNKADMQSFEEWKEMRLKDAAQLKDKQQQQQAANSQAINNNVSSQQAATGASGSTGNGQNGQAKPEKGAGETSSPNKKPTNGGSESGSDSSGLIHRRKNYASTDCGAKIIANNPEANNPWHVLSESKDDYMLNSCKANIWFVIELCEPVKINEIELANLELFSNVPRQFNVYASERFPQSSNGKEWQNKYWLGTFEATNSRSIQRFSIHSNEASGENGQGGLEKDSGAAAAAQASSTNVIMFSKYVRFEMLSHYGTEHYCPLTLVRIYGTSMADEEEVLQTSEIDDVHAHHLTISPESIKTAAAGDGADDIKILVNENDLKVDSSAAKEPTQSSVQAAAETGKPAAPPKAKNKFLGHLQNSLINTIISIFPYENFNITKLFGSLTGNRNYFGSDKAAEAASGKAGEAKMNNMGRPTKSTLIENQTNEASSHQVKARNSSPVSLVRSQEGSFMPVVLTNYKFSSKEERDRAATLQIDLHKLLCATSRFGASAIRLDDETDVDCCQCRTHSANATNQKLRASLVAKYCGYYFSMMTSAQSRSQNSLLSKYAMNTHLSLPASVLDDSSDTLQLFTRISINNINYYILNELLDNRTEPATDGVASASTLTPETRVEEQVQKAPEPAVQAQETPEASLSEKNDSKNGDEEDKLRYTNLTTNESNLLDRDPSRGTDSSMNKFNLESDRNKSFAGKAEAPATATPVAVTASQETEAPKAADGKESDKEKKAEAESASPDAELSELAKGQLPTEGVVPLEQLASESAKTAEETESSSSSSEGASQDADRQQQAQGASQGAPRTQPIVIGNGKEALIMRLSNRIKMLELNMTLSSQYLEKLSQHYKKQMDEMQRAFNLTTSALKNATRIADERELKQQERIALVEKRLESMQGFIDSLNLYMTELKFETDLMMFGGIVFAAVIVILEVIRCMRHAFVTKSPPTRASTELEISDAPPGLPPISQRDLERLIARQVELYLQKQLGELSGQTGAPTNDKGAFETIRSDFCQPVPQLEHPPGKYELDDKPPPSAMEPMEKQVTTAAAVVSSTLTAVVAAVSLAAAAKASCAKLNSASEEIDT